MQVIPMKTKNIRKYLLYSSVQIFFFLGGRGGEPQLAIFQLVLYDIVGPSTIYLNSR